MATIKRLGLSLSNLSGITTDGAPSVTERQHGLGTLLQREASKTGNDSTMQFHCITHQENLCKMSWQLSSKQSIFFVPKGYTKESFKSYYAAWTQTLKIFHTTLKSVG